MNFSEAFDAMTLICPEQYERSLESMHHHIYLCCRAHNGFGVGTDHGL
jgi:hypothetical protein